MQNKTVSGLLLILGSGLSMLVMIMHPTGHDMMSGIAAERQAMVNMTVHGVALVTIPMLFLGFTGLTRHFANSDFATSGLVSFGFAAGAVMASAVASGFIATDVIWNIAEADAATRPIYEALLSFSSSINQGFDKIYVGGSAIAFSLWSIPMLNGERLDRATGILGFAVSIALFVILFSGRRFDVAAFTIVMFSQSLWMVVTGGLLVRQGRRARKSVVV